MDDTPVSMKQLYIGQEGNWAGNIARLDIDCDKCIAVQLYSDNNVV